MNFINTNPELQKVFEQNAKKKKPEVKKQVPASEYQILAERVFPLVALLVIVGVLQILSALYYNPMETSNGFANIASIAIVDSDMPFAIQVRNTRVGKGMSRRELGRYVGLSVDNIASIEEGDATPTKEVEFALCEILGLEARGVEKGIAANP